jgi:asparagine synthetase B (glutamine-hydrolysing)
MGGWVWGIGSHHRPVGNALQPMSNEDATLIFQLRIYNHADIHVELKRLSRHCWKTDYSDTEVILHAFEDRDIEFVQELRGMFAITPEKVELRDASPREKQAGSRTKHSRV